MLHTSGFITSLSMFIPQLPGVYLTISQVKSCGIFLPETRNVSFPSFQGYHQSFRYHQFGGLAPTRWSKWLPFLIEILETRCGFSPSHRQNQQLFVVKPTIPNNQPTITTLPPHPPSQSLPKICNLQFQTKSAPESLPREATKVPHGPEGNTPQASVFVVKKMEGKKNISGPCVLKITRFVSTPRWRMHVGVYTCTYTYIYIY